MGTGGVGPVAEAPLVRGDVVGRYVVLELIGQGATGAVYKAFDPELDRTVAMKLLLGAGGASRAHLVREAQAIAKVSHPNVIAVHDVGTHGGRVFYAMELVDGRPLSQWRRTTNPSVEQILDVFVEAGTGLAAAHAAGVVHRDFKPDNVLIDSTGRVRVLDFGLAQRGASPVEGHADQSLDPVSTQALVGTPAYMAPEQFAGQPADARTDQFAFCIALHEALTGQRPFAGDSIASLSYNVLNDARLDVSLSGVPTRVASAMERGLSPRPEDRFPSMRPLLDAMTLGSRPRRGRVAAVGFGALVVTAATAYGLGRTRGETPSPDPCQSVSAAMDAAWTADRRAAVRDAFERTGAHEAASMAKRVLQALDGYAGRWSDAARRSCEMVEVEHTLDDELTFRARRCIDDALAGFETLLAGLESLPAERVESSLDEVDGLSAPEVCTNRSMLELQVEVPGDPVLRQRVSDAMSAYDVAEEHHQQERNGACLDTLGPLEDTVRALGHGPSLVRVLELRANCQFAAGKDEDARRTMMMVFERSLASGHDTMAIGSAVRIAHVLALRTEEFERAEGWLRRAEALAERHGLEQAPSMHGVLNVWAILAAKQGDHDAAVESFRRLAEITRDSPRKHLAATTNVGVALANSGRPAEALEQFERAAAFAEEHWGPQHTKTAVERTRVAQMAYVLGHVRKAGDLLKDALAVIHRTTPRSLPLATSTHVLSMAEAKLGNHDEALRLARKAYAMRVELDAAENFVATDVLDDLSRFELRAGNVDAAEQAAQTLLKLCESTGQPLDVARALGRVAAVSLAKGENDAARRTMLRAHELATSSAETRRPAAKAEALYGLAVRFLELDDAERALALHRRAEAVLDGEDSPWAVSAARLRFVRVHVREGRTAEARALLEAVEGMLEASPYPAESVEEARALREQLRD